VQEIKRGNFMSDIKERVVKIVEKHFGVTADNISESTHFVADLSADSLATVEFVMDLEDEFDIVIPEDAADKIRTVGAAIDYIKAQGH
jgi:acyl carrier protein